MPHYHTVNVRDSAKERFDKAQEVIESEVEGSVSQSEVVDELVAAYLGQDCVARRERAD